MSRLSPGGLAMLAVLADGQPRQVWDMARKAGVRRVHRERVATRLSADGFIEPTSQDGFNLDLFYKLTPKGSDMVERERSKAAMVAAVSAAPASRTTCIHAVDLVRCRRRAHYFGKWAGGGLCLWHAIDEGRKNGFDVFHAEFRDELTQASAREDAT